MSNNNLSILGINIELLPIDRSQLKGLNADTLLNFSFYSTVFRNQVLCIIEPKRRSNYTPLKYKRLVEKIESVVGMPVVVSLDKPAYYERERLIIQGVYFIASDKYAFLPMLIANEPVKAKQTLRKLTPVAQYVLLYYLQNRITKSLTIKDLQAVMPYNYLALSRAIVVLENNCLCHCDKSADGTKNISFTLPKRELWTKAQACLTSPVKKVYYSDNLPDTPYAVSGVNALAHYSHLNPERYGSVAVWDKYFAMNDLYNEVEGDYSIEVWKYPPVMPSQPSAKTVDKLSLYLSLKDEIDARIERELQLMIEKMPW